MGGKSTKLKADSTAQGVGPKSSNTSKPATSSKKPEIANKGPQYEITYTKHDAKKPVSAELQEDAFIRSVLSLFFEGERLLQLCEDEEIFGKRLASFSDSTIPCVRFLRALQKSIIGPDHDARKAELHSCIQEVLKKPEVYGKQDPATALFHALYTGLLVIRVDSFQTEKSLQQTLNELVNQDYEKIAGNIEETIILEGLFRDACSKTGTEFPESPGESDLASVKEFVAKLQPSDIWPLTKLPNFCAQIEKILFAHFAGEEGLEMTVPLQNLLERIRTEINKNLKSKFFDIHLIRPLPAVKHLSSLTVFPCFNNLTFGKLSFFSNQIFPRTKKIKCMVHIPESQGTVRKYNCVLDIVVHVYMNSIALDERSCIYRHKTLKNLIPQLKKFGDAKDIEADYDPIAVYEKEGKLLMSFKEEQLFGHYLDMGNTVFMQVFLFHENGVNSPDLLKIMFHPNARQSTHLAESFLMVFKHDDTLRTLYDKLETLYPDVLENFNSESGLLQLLMFTNVLCKSPQFYETCWTQTQAFFGQGAWETRLSDIVEKFGKGSPLDEDPHNRQVDLIVSLRKRFYEFSGSGREENTITELKMRLAMDDVWNQALQMSFGERINPESEEALREDELRQLLPSYLYVDLSQIENLIEVPTKFDMYALKGMLDSLGNPLNYRYRVTGFIYGNKTTPSRSYQYDEVVRKVTFVGEDLQKKSKPVTSLDISSIKGVYLSRREVDID